MVRMYSKNESYYFTYTDYVLSNLPVNREIPELHLEICSQ